MWQEEEQRGEGRREDLHLFCWIPLDLAPMVSFPTLHDSLRLCKWWFLGSYGRGLDRSGGNYRKHVYIFPFLDIQVQRSSVSSTQLADARSFLILTISSFTI
jgi:hypothetical protein